VAEYALIDGYLETLRMRLGRRRDLDDVVAEAKDHLYSALERLEADGVEPQLAQRRVLEQFGEPDATARAHARTPQGGLAVSTAVTSNAGNLAIVCALLWVVGWASLIGACVLMVVVVQALDERHGGLGRAGRAGMGLASLSALASIAGWVYAGWAIPLTIATLLVAASMLRRGIAPRIPSLAFGAGFASGALVWIASRALAGPEAQWVGVGFWGESFVPNSVALTVGACVLALGLIGLGRWLRAEEPLDLEVADDRPARWKIA
jgi:hypothetical protein